jgi:serpin B
MSSKPVFRVLTLSLAFATAAAATSVAQAPMALPADAAKVAQDANAFAHELYAKLAQRDGNLFFSPYSISTALAMTYAGARGETAQQMATTLHFTLNPDRLHPAFAALMRVENATGKQRGYQLAVANALWGQSGYVFQPGFLELTRKNYGAGLREVDFAGEPEAARRAINAWVEKETQEKIKDLLKQGMVHKDLRLVLTNAIYFKSAWLHSFGERATRKEDFFVRADSKVAADMMQRTGDYSFYEDKELQLLDMPYERRDLSFIALLPRAKNGLAALEKNLTAATVDGWVKACKTYRVDVKFPKFKMTREFDLKKTLEDMGMPLAFSLGADFSGISTEQRLKIGFVQHKAFIDLNEKGTEAAAATAVGIEFTSAPPPPPFKAVFHADHPFVFMIRDNRTGSILFMGRVVNPAG